MSRVMRVAVSIGLVMIVYVANAALTAQKVQTMLSNPAFQLSEELVSDIVLHYVALTCCTAHIRTQRAISQAIKHIERNQNKACPIKTYIRQRIEKGLPVDDFAWCAKEVSKIRTLVSHQSKKTDVYAHAHDTLVKRREKTSSMMQKRGAYSYAQPLKQDPSGECIRSRRHHRARSHG